jgi:hypothetical protein
VYSKIVRGLKYAVFSSTATAKTDKAVFNFTVDEASGLCGFHVFAGSIIAGNISVQGEQAIRPGDMTTVPPDAPPSQPVRINAKQMSVLTRFYGSDFINQEIEASGIEIVSSSSSSKFESAEMKQEVRPGEAVPAAHGRKAPGLFDDDALLRRLDEYQALHEWMFQTPARADPLASRRFRFSAVFSPALYGDRFYNDFFLRPGYFTEYFSAVLNLPLVADSSGKLTFDTFRGGRGVLDKIYSLEGNYKKSFIRLGSIDGVTLGYGGLMKNYSNRVNSDNVRNTGLALHYEGYLAEANALTASLADFHLSVLEGHLEDSALYAGAAIILESGQKLGLNNGDFGYRAGATGSLPDSAFEAPAVSLLFPEFDLGATVINRHPLRASVYSSFFGVLWNGKANLKGWGMTAPGLEIVAGRFLASLELFFGKNFMLRHTFNPFYEDNLLLLKKDMSVEPPEIDSVVTLQSETIRSPTHIGFGTAFKAEPFKGLAFSVEFEKTFAYFGRDTNNHIIHASGRKGGMLDVRLTAGKGLFRRLPWAEVYYSNYHCAYFTHDVFSPFKPNTFTEMGGRVHALILDNLEGFAGFERFFYDADGNFRVTPSLEAVRRFTVGLTYAW